MAVRVLIAGMDGYLGWSLALHLAKRGHEVAGFDNFSRRSAIGEIGSQSMTPIANMENRLKAAKELHGLSIGFGRGSTLDYGYLRDVLKDFKPDSVVHLAEQPSAPYSMIDREHAVYTQENNVIGTLNLLFEMKEFAKGAQLVKLGTMGEYGTPNVAIPEGFFEVEYRGRKDTLPFPRQAGSWYHQSKVHDTANIMFACKIWGLRSTDIMQGVVYGTRTPEMTDRRLLTRFDFDECFVGDTPVIANPDVRPIVDVLAGEKVLTHTGSFQPVLRKMVRHYSGLVYKLRFVSGSVTVTPKHPFLTVSRIGHKKHFGEPRWMTATEMHEWFLEHKAQRAADVDGYNRAITMRRAKGWGAHRIARALGIKPTTVESWVNHAHKPRRTTHQRDNLYLVHPVMKDVADVERLDCGPFNSYVRSKYNPGRKVRNPIPDSVPLTASVMRLFGFYIAEGSIGRGYQFVLSFDRRKDMDHVRECIDTLQSIFGLKARWDGREVRANSVALCRLVNSLFGSGAETKRIPTWFLTLPVAKQKPFTNAIFDGDGSKGNHLELVNRHLVESVRLMLARRGLFSTIYTRSRTTRLPNGRLFSGTRHTLVWSDPSRARNSVKLSQGNFLLPLRAVESAPFDGEVFNLHVARDNSYTASGVVAHNCFGTAINRFCAQAAIGFPLSPYGTGHMRRGFIALVDSIQCMTIAIERPPKEGEYRVFNQLDEVYGVGELARMVAKTGKEKFGLETEVKEIGDPRMEAQEHFYEVDHKQLRDLGFRPTRALTEELEIMLGDCLKYKSRIEEKKEHITPTITWREGRKQAGPLSRF